MFAECAGSINILAINCSDRVNDERTVILCGGVGEVVKAAAESGEVERGVLGRDEGGGHSTKPHVWGVGHGRARH